MPTKQIKKIVMKNLFWINKKLYALKFLSVKNKPQNNHKKIYYIGKSYPLKIISNKDNKTIDIAFKHFSFYVNTPLKYSYADFAKALNSFYKTQAIEKITPIVAKHSRTMKVTPAKISFRYAKTRWGSCSSKHNISLNYHLIKLPINLIEYIIIHELAHIVHHNHSKDFWGLVQKYLPDYKEKHKQIKEYEKIFSSQNQGK